MRAPAVYGAGRVGERALCDEGAWKASLDIGSYGIWGEWHTTHPASIAVRQQIVDMYLRAFTRTPLVYMSDDADVMSYALAHGAGLRRDGVGDPWHEQRYQGD